MVLIADIQTYSLHDGPGIRTCVHLKGCPLRCWWCHNPESQRQAPEITHDTERCVACGDCVQACPAGALRLDAEGPRGYLPAPQSAMRRPLLRRDRRRCLACGACASACAHGAMRLVGREVAVADLVPELVRDRPFFEASGGGVTLTGGEPTAQFDAMLDLLAALRAVGIHTAVETCGHFTPARVTDLADATDLLLFDLKHAEAAIHEAATGVGLEVIRANFIGLLERMGAGRLVARVPLIGGFNTGSDEVAALAAWLVETCGYGGEVHLLPGHGWARHKYETLGRGAAYRPVTPPGPGDRLRIETTLTDRGLIPVWGG